MIKVTVWNEFVQENETDRPESVAAIRAVHPNGIHETLREIFETDEQLCVRTATLDMPECGLTKEVLDDTDVLVWWAHVAHERVPEEISDRVRDYVLRGMGFVALHSAHPSRPLQKLLGTSGSLKWREGDFCRVWNLCPTHPIAEGIPESFELEEEEMYGEFFDIPKPDDVVFTSWFRGGEVFRSGCTWTRGYGKIFYFQPGHETNKSYFNPYVRKILINAVKWAKPSVRVGKLDCPHAEISPEEAWQKKHEK